MSNDNAASDNVVPFSEDEKDPLYCLNIAVAQHIRSMNTCNRILDYGERLLELMEGFDKDSPEFSALDEEDQKMVMDQMKDPKMLDFLQKTASTAAKISKDLVEVKKVSIPVGGEKPDAKPRVGLHKT